MQACDKTGLPPAGTQQRLNQLAKCFPFLIVKHTFVSKGVKRIPPWSFANPITNIHNVFHRVRQITREVKAPVCRLVPCSVVPVYLTDQKNIYLFYLQYKKILINDLCYVY